MNGSLIGHGFETHTQTHTPQVRERANALLLINFVLLAIGRNALLHSFAACKLKWVHAEH